MAKGKNCYIPRSVIDEIEHVKRQRKIFDDGKALREMANYSKVGREVERMANRFTLGLLPIPERKKKR